jgi:Tetracyclin repressor-like, C-terminal domain
VNACEVPVLTAAWRLRWSEQVIVLVRRLRAVLERHLGIAGLGPHSLALAEAFLGALQPAGLPDRQIALAFSLIYDYTVSFALNDRGTVNELPVQDSSTRLHLHKFLRSLPVGQFPALVAVGEHVWADNRDERFIASVLMLLGGIEAAQHPAGQ